MKKIILVLLSIVLLNGCNNGVLKGNISASISSSISSTTSSSNEIIIPEKSTKEYLQKALTSLFLLNNSCEIKQIKNNEEQISAFYYDFTKNIYQYSYDNIYITYKDSKIYFDNNDKHYFMNSNDFNGYTIITSIIALEYINLDFLTLEKNSNKVTLSYETKYCSININIKEGIVTSLENIELKLNNSSIIITPKKLSKIPCNIDKYNHENIFGVFDILKTIKTLIKKDNIEASFDLNYKNIIINGNIKKQNKEYSGYLNYNYLESSIAIQINEDNYKYNNEEMNLYTLLQNVMLHLDQIVIDELLDYTNNLIKSEKRYEDNKIIFTSDDFNEIIEYNNKTIKFATLNLNIKLKEII